MTDDRLRDDLGASGPEPALYALSAVVYAERDGEILLLKRAEGSAMAGEWFLPGGAIEPGELPEDGARREVLEESGLELHDLELIGCYPIHAYGHQILNLSYRGRVRAGDTTVSSEHTDARWVKAEDMRALLTDEVIDGIARGEERILSMLHHIRSDLDRYLARAAESSI